MADLNPNLNICLSNKLEHELKTMRLSEAQALPVDDNLIPFVELLFFAYRDFISDPDEILSKYNFGRAHHRVLHFVNQDPGLRVADLLQILKITKQSLSRVLKQLIDEDFIRQETGASDRRERRLYTTDKGKQLAESLIAPQINRIKSSLKRISADDQKQIIQFLYAMIEDQDDKITAGRLQKFIKQSYEG